MDVKKSKESREYSLKHLFFQSYSVFFIILGYNYVTSSAANMLSSRVDKT